jgi:hypothetical protein
MRGASIPEADRGTAILRSGTLRYAIFAIASPIFAVWITFWVFTDLSYFLPDAPVKISYYRDFASHKIADAVGIVFGGMIGIPLMFIFVMPYCARLLEKGELRVRFYMVPAVVVGPVFAFVIFPIFFGLRDGLSFAAPTLFACFIAMLFVYIGYVVGAPHVTPEMLSDQYGITDEVEPVTKADPRDD